MPCYSKVRFKYDIYFIKIEINGSDSLYFVNFKLICSGDTLNFKHVVKEMAVTY